MMKPRSDAPLLTRIWRARVSYLMLAPFVLYFFLLLLLAGILKQK